MRRRLVYPGTYGARVHYIEYPLCLRDKRIVGPREATRGRGSPCSTSRALITGFANTITPDYNPARDY